jgi:hypothetical protein
VAYHYYMMNLRYIVVHPDPSSRTSPESVLNLWRDRIHFEVWDRSRFTNDTYEVDNPGGRHTDQQMTNKRSNEYVRRQMDFFHSCATHLKARNRTWTSFQDNDEYLVVTPLANVSADDIQRGPGIALRLFEAYSSKRNDPAVLGRYNETDHWQFGDWDVWFSARPCVVLPRMLVGATPSNESDVANGVPPFLDPYRFDTFRWRYQSTKRHRSDGPGKGFVDLSRLPASYLDETARLRTKGSVHRPFMRHCTHSWPAGNRLPLIMNHYVGSWEAYSYRDDVRKGGIRTHADWKKKAAGTDGGINDYARPWINGFVSMVGVEAAKALLRDAGLPRNYTKSTNESEGWGAGRR